MKKIFFLLFIYLSVLLLPSEVTGLRKIKPGDKIPVTGPLKVFKDAQLSARTPGKKLIFYYKSGDTRSTAFLKTLTKVLQDNNKQAKELTIFLVDANGKEAGSEEGFPSPPVRVNDKQRLIYGELGVIVIPSLILVNPDHTLHSLIAGLRHNLGMFISGYLEALAAGKKPGNLYEFADKNRAAGKISKMLKQAFLLMINGNYQLSGMMYAKALKSDAENSEALLGKGYTLLMMDKTDEATAYFSQLKEKLEQRVSRQTGKDGGQFMKRVLLGYYLCRAEKEPLPENLVSIGQQALLEPNFFMVIYRAGEILEREKKYQLSSDIYQRAYKILLRKIRRSKAK